MANATASGPFQPQPGRRFRCGELTRDRIAQPDASYARMTPQRERTRARSLRDELTQLELDQLCFGLTMRRAGEERSQGPSAASSMLKLCMDSGRA